MLQMPELMWMHNRRKAAGSHGPAPRERESEEYKEAEQLVVFRRSEATYYAGFTVEFILVGVILAILLLLPCKMQNCQSSKHKT